MKMVVMIDFGREREAENGRGSYLDEQEQEEVEDLVVVCIKLVVDRSIKQDQQSSFG